MGEMADHFRDMEDPMEFDRMPEPMPPEEVAEWPEWQARALAAESRLVAAEGNRDAMTKLYDATRKNREAAEALNTRYREALARVKEAAKTDDRDQAVRLVDEALSSPVDSQEQG